MFDNTLSAAAAWDDAPGLMVRDVSTGQWVEYDPSWPPDYVDVVPLEVLLDDGDPAEPGMDELDGWDAPVPPADELPPVDTTIDNTDDTDTDEGASGHAGHCDADAGDPVPIPDGLTSMPPGPDLATTLASIQVRRMSGYDTVDVMTAAYRQASHARAVFLAALVETGMRRPGSADTVSRVTHPGEFAAEEARTALAWSRRRADGTFEFAWDIHERLPMLGQAMFAGVLDEPRVRAFIQWTTGLTDDQAGHIITHLLPVAAGLPVGELIDRIKHLAIAIDPNWAERRYRAAVKGRRVEGSRNDDGTANIAGLDLPIDRAAAACDRIDTLARACKHAGDSRPINHIRADLYLGMLDGTLDHLDEDEIITYVLTHPFTDTDGGDGTGPDGGSTGGGDSDGGDEGTGPAGHDGDTGPGDGPTGPNDGGRGGSPSGGEHPSGGNDIDRGGTGPTGRHDGGGSDPAIDAHPDPDSDHDHRDDHPTDGDDRDGDDTDRGTGPDGTDSTAAAARGGEVSRGRTGGDDPVAASRGPDTTAPATRTPGPVAPRSAAPWPAPPDTDGSRSQPNGSRSAGSGSAGWSVRELRVEIAALLGLNEHPAEIVGWDFIPAALARTVIGSMHGAHWRWVICDQHGRPIDTGITRHRPHPPPGTGGTGQRPPPPRRDAGRRAGIVELQLRAVDLPALAAATATGEGPHHAWTAVITDIATQHRATTDADDDAGQDDHTDAITDASDSAGEDNATAMRDARRRSARAGLRRRVQIRDRSCVHPSCRTPATRTDQDHAEEHADGGATTEANLGSLCRHDHRVRHDGGWRLWKPTPERTVLGSPLGRTYTSRPPPVMPATPKPWPATDTAAAAAPSRAPRKAATPARSIDPTTDAPPF